MVDRSHKIKEIMPDVLLGIKESYIRGGKTRFGRFIRRVRWNIRFRGIKP